MTERPHGETRQIWNQYYTLEYFKALARNYNFLLRAKDYPLEIDPPGTIKDLLSKITAGRNGGDLRERVFLTGFKDQDAPRLCHLLLPDTGERLKYNINLAKVKTRAEQEQIDGFLGIFHNHTTVQRQILFSLPDLHIFLSNNFFFSGVSDGISSLYAFKTRESIPVNIPGEHFSRYWTNQVAEYSTDSHSMLEINKAVARTHNLVVYQGPLDGRSRRLRNL